MAQENKCENVKYLIEKNLGCGQKLYRKTQNFNFNRFFTVLTWGT